MRANRNVKENILVTGGAGYIGSHTCKYLASFGLLPIAFDDLSVGHESAVRWGPLVVADIADSSKLSETIDQYRFSTVIHFAASAYVSESIANPRKYFYNNLVKTISFLDTLLTHGVHEIIFSSTCATYGIPEQIPIRETHPQNPVNPYGESKLAAERVLRWYGEAYGLKWISLRYFNAAGADPEGEVGERHSEENRLIPLALGSVLPGRRPLQIFGLDYPTLDGTAVRDYIHVTDLATAHYLAVNYLREGGRSQAFNLGTGRGHSVKEVLAAIERSTKRIPSTVQCERRAGDPAILVADASLARQELGWITKNSDLPTIVETAWLWFERQASTKSLGRSELVRAAPCT